MTNKLLYFGVGITVGAIGGYLIADFLAYKFLENYDLEEVEEDPSKEPGYYVDEELPESTESLDLGGVNYKDIFPKAETEKGDLAKLAAIYENSDEPFIVPFEDWNDLEPNWKVEIITFYAEDSIWCDENEDLIKTPDANRLFGPNMHLQFGEESGDEDVVYVCNPGEMMKYELIRVHDSYKVQVLGEEPKPKRGRPKGSRNKSKPEDTDDEE